MTTRKKHSKEFKLDAITLVLDQGYTRTEAARSLATNANADPVGQAGDSLAFRANGNAVAESFFRSLMQERVH